MDLEVSDISSNNPDFTVDQTSLSVPVGESWWVVVTFIPSSVGFIEGILTVTSNDPDEPTVDIDLSGTGVAAILSIPKVCATPAETTVVSIDVDNQTWIDTPTDSRWIELSFDDSLLAVAKVEQTTRTSNMSIFDWDVPNPGRLTIQIWDEYGSLIESGTGSIAEVSFAISEDAIIGESTQLQFLAVDLMDAQSEVLPVIFEDGTVSFGEMTKGDVNCDGQVNVIDVVIAINIILNITDPSPDEFWAADCNHDGAVNIIDAVCIVNIILGP